MRGDGFSSYMRKQLKNFLETAPISIDARFNSVVAEDSFTDPGGIEHTGEIGGGGGGMSFGGFNDLLSSRQSGTWYVCEDNALVLEVAAAFTGTDHEASIMVGVQGGEPGGSSRIKYRLVSGEGNGEVDSFRAEIPQNTPYIVSVGGSLVHWYEQPMGGESTASELF